MVEQKTPDYWQIFSQLMHHRSELVRKRDEAEVELAKMKQMILSVFALLSEDQQKANQQAIDDVKAESAGIQDAIKTAFSLHSGEWLSASNVREHLAASGFEFREYKANPLSTIITTLKRLGDTGYLEVKAGAPGMPHTTLYLRNDPVSKLAPNVAAERAQGTAPPLSVPMNTPGTSLRPQERFSLDHTRPAKKTKRL